MSQRRLARPLGPGELSFWFTHLADASDSSNHLHRLLELDSAVEFEEASARVTALARGLPILGRAVTAGHRGTDPWVFDVDGEGQSWIHREAGIGEPSEIDASVRMPFDVSVPPLFRLHVFSTDGRTRLLFVAHHLLIDGLTFDNLTTDIVRAITVARTTSAFTVGTVDVPVPWQRVDVDAWQPLSHAPDHRVGLRPRGAGDVSELRTLTAATVAAVGRIRQATGHSSATILLGVWLATIHRVLDLPDIVVATQVDVRPRLDRSAAGMYVNTVPVRSGLPRRCSWAAFNDSVRDNIILSLRHRFEPFDDLLELVKPERRADRSTFMTDFEFSLMRRWQPPRDVVESGVSISEILRPDPGTRFGLSMNVVDGGEDMHLRWAAAGSLYSPGDVDLLHGCVERFISDLEASVADSARGPTDVDLVDDAELDRILTLGTGRTAAVGNLSTTARFVQLAAQFPDKVAVVHRGQETTYAALENRAALVAGALSSAGVEVGSRVLVSCSRGVNHIASMIAVLHLGAVYVPCDPSNPPARVAQMISEVTPKAAIVDPAAHDGLLGVLASETNIIDLSQIEPGAGVLAKAAKPSHAAQPAYIVFTSGSTGRPKAVEIGCEAFVNHLEMIEEDLGIDTSSTVAQTAPIAFDIHVWQCLSAVLVGGCISVFDEQDLHDPEAFAGRVAAERVTELELVPSYLHLLIGPLESAPEGEFAIRSLLPTGEALSPDLALRLLNAVPAARVFNAYGPAEAADDVTLEPLSSENITDRVPIGWPARNVRMRVVDRWLRVRPVGLAGEIVIGGLALANGYVADPVSESFCADPYLEGQRLYRTGDLGALFLPTGFSFLGRRDDQVKVGGRRIELVEVDAALRSLPHIIDAATTAVRRGGRSDLVAYVVTNQPNAVGSVRSALRGLLPAGMIPRTVRSLDRLPTTRNGKVDRRALEQVALEATPPESTGADDTVAELVRRAWVDVLDVLDVQPEECSTGGFFEIGGDSLAAAEVIAHLRASGVPIGVRDLYEHQDLAAFTGAVRDSIRDRSARVESIEAVTASPRQIEMLDKVALGARIPVQAMIVRNGPGPSELLAALSAIVRRRPELRLAFTSANDAGWQAVVRSPDDENTPRAGHVTATSSVAGTTGDLALVRQAAGDLDLTIGRHIGLASDAGGNTCIVASHLVCDLVAMHQLLADLHVEMSNSHRIGTDGTSPFMRWLHEVARRTRVRRTNGIDVYCDEVAACSEAVAIARATSSTNDKPWTREIDGVASLTVTHPLPVPIRRADLELIAVSAVSLALTEIMGAATDIRIDLDVNGRREFEAAAIVGDGVGCFTLLAPLPIRTNRNEDRTEAMVTAASRAISMARTRWAWDTTSTPVRTLADQQLDRVPLLNLLGEVLALPSWEGAGSWRVPTCTTAWNATADPHGLVIDVGAKTDPRGHLTAVELRFTLRTGAATSPLLDLPEQILAGLNEVAAAVASKHRRKSPDGLDIAGVSLAELDVLLGEDPEPSGGQDLARHDK